MITIGVNDEQVDEQELVTGRSCIIAQSGAGKSYGVAVICEELASKGIGFCIIDTEGEYYSLKNKFNVLWVGGDDSDLPIKNVDLSLLAERVVSGSVPLIIDVSDADEQQLIVDKWLNSLWHVENKLRKPYLLIVEEADKFIPQRGDKLLIINEIARRGRKRGLGLMIASQRPAIVDKGVLSQCNIQFIGRLTLDNDLSAVKYYFNSRDNLKHLPDLMPGEFFMIGFKPNEELFKFRKRLTIHEGLTPKISYTNNGSVNEIINELKGLSNAVKPLLSMSDAKLIADKYCRKKFILFGEKERVNKVKLVFKPLIEVLIATPHKSFFSEELIKGFVYLTPELFIVDNMIKQRFNLSFLKELNHNDVLIIIGLLYNNCKTISDLVKFTGLNKSEVILIVRELINKGLVIKNGWDGSEQRLIVEKGVEVPRITSLFTNKIITNYKFNGDYNVNEDLIKSLFSSINTRSKIKNIKVIYYPFYEVELVRSDTERVIRINAVSGALW